METIIKVLTDWLPPLTVVVDTPTEKLILLVTIIFFGQWLYWKVLRPAAFIVWRIVVGFVCTCSLNGLILYAAHKQNRRNRLKWRLLPHSFFSYWLDFALDGFDNTVIRNRFWMWKGPFTWIVIAQKFRDEPTLKELAAYKRGDPPISDESDNDEIDNDEPDYVYLTPEQMRESDRRDEAELNYSVFDKHHNEHPDDALLRKLHEPINPKDKDK